MLQNPFTAVSPAARWVAVLVLMFVGAAVSPSFAQTTFQAVSVFEPTYPNLAAMGCTEVSSSTKSHSAGTVVTHAIRQEQQTHG